MPESTELTGETRIQMQASGLCLASALLPQSQLPRHELSWTITLGSSWLTHKAGAGAGTMVSKCPSVDLLSHPDTSTWWPSR